MADIAALVEERLKLDDAWGGVQLWGIFRVNDSPPLPPQVTRVDVTLSVLSREILPYETLKLADSIQARRFPLTASVTETLRLSDPLTPPVRGVGVAPLTREAPQETRRIVDTVTARLSRLHARPAAESLHINESVFRNYGAGAGTGGYVQARSGIAISGVTHAGWVPPRPRFYLGGVDLTDHLLRKQFTVTERREGVYSRCTFYLEHMTPSLWQDVRITYSTPDDYIFVGTLVQAQMQFVGPEDPDSLHWNCMAVGRVWLLNYHKLVTGRFINQKFNTIVGSILNQAAPAGRFRVGEIPDNLGTTTAKYELQRLSSCIDGLAGNADASWLLQERKGYTAVSFQSDTDVTTDVQEPIVINDSEGELREISYLRDGTQVRNLVYAPGDSAATISMVPVGSPTIPVDDLSKFDPEGGQVLVEENLATYTGVSAGSGSGLLLGVSGIVYEVAEGANVRIIAVEEDPVAQAALAAAIGGSGIAQHAIQGGDFQRGAAANFSLSDLAKASTELKQIDYHTMHRRTRIGRVIDFNVTSPVGIQGSFRVQNVEMKPQGAINDEIVDIDRYVSASRFTRALSKFLQSLPG